MSLTSWLLLLKPDGCGDGEHICVPKKSYSSVLFYMAIYLVALGYGGHQPTIATFGADQLNDGSKAAFFSYFYLALNTGSLFSNTVLAFYEDLGKWTVGFWAAAASAGVALTAYLLGSPGYRYIKPCGNPIPRVMQVFMAASRKCNVVPAKGEALYEVQGLESAIKGSRKIVHTDDFA